MRKWFFTAIGVCAILLIVLVFLLVSCRGSNENVFHVYHFNPSAQRLEAEARAIPSEGSLVEAAVRYMHSGPVSGGLVTTWPYELAPLPEDLFQAIRPMPEENMMLVFLNPIFSDIPPLAQSLFKAALVHTMESLIERTFPHITDIKILVTDNYMYAFDALMLNISAEEGEEVPDVPWLIYDGTAGIYIDPSLRSALTAPSTFNHLHFIDESGAGLIVETHVTEEVDQHLEERVRYVLLLLINGLQPEDNGIKPEGALFLIPQETVINNVIPDIVPGMNDVFIDFSTDFMARFIGGRDLAELMIYSIVNTLTAEFIGINRVHFLIDTHQYESFHGVEYFDQPFERNDTFLLSYIEEREREREREQREREEWGPLE